MPRTVADRLDEVPLRNVKAGLSEGESPRQKMTPAGALVELAMNSAELEAKQLADAMGVSPSFLLRGFKDNEHISFQRLRRAGQKYPRFKRELLKAEAKDTEGVEVVTEIRVA